MSTRVRAVREAVDTARAAHPNEDIVVVCERSIYSDRYIFVDMLHRAGDMTDAERCVYETAFEFFGSYQHAGKHGGVIYLRTDPAACAARIVRRDRVEEADINGAYLKGLHEAHERALGTPGAWKDAPVLTVDVESLGSLPDDDAVADALAARIRAFITDGKCP